MKISKFSEGKRGHETFNDGSIVVHRGLFAHRGKTIARIGIGRAKPPPENSIKTRLLSIVLEYVVHNKLSVIFYNA